MCLCLVRHVARGVSRGVPSDGVLGLCLNCVWLRAARLLCLCVCVFELSLI